MKPNEASTYSQNRRDPLLAVTWLYLWLPVLLFLTAWFRPELGGPVGLLAGGAVLWLMTRRTVPVNEPGRLSGQTWAVLAGLSLGWAWLSGMGGFVSQHQDYYKHNLIFRDLLDHPWPVHYRNPARHDPFLCYYLAYYLPPTGLLKTLGLPRDWLHGLSFGWGWLGIWLVLAWVVRLSGRRGLWVATGLLLLSGLEVGLRLGWSWLVEFDGNWQAFQTAWSQNNLFRYTRYHPPRFFFSDHSWAHSLDATPLMTQLRATPQHALAGWLGAALWRHGYRHRWGLGHWGMLLAPTLLWSPFVTIGLGVCVLADELTQPGPLLQNLRRTDPATGALTAVAGLVTAGITLYLAAHEPVTGGGFLPLTWQRPSDPVLFLAYFGLQYGLPLWLFRWAARQRPDLHGWIHTAGQTAAIIGLLSLIHLGLLNDFQVRAIIPAQFAFMLAVANGLAAAVCGPHQRTATSRRAQAVFLVWGGLATLATLRLIGYLLWAWLLHTKPARIVNNQADMSQFSDNDGSSFPFDFAPQYLGRRNSWYWTVAAPDSTASGAVR